MFNELAMQELMEANSKVVVETTLEKAEILFITSYPPRECGIATYSDDLIKALNNTFNGSFLIKVCALESGVANHPYGKEVEYILNTSVKEDYEKIAEEINGSQNIEIVLFQHEFGLYTTDAEIFIAFLNALKKPIVMVFHTVLSKPEATMRDNVKNIEAVSKSIIVMTNDAAAILQKEYNISQDKITVIPHGTHLVPHLDRDFLKEKYGLKNKMVLSTFGLLSSGKSIETTIDALPEIVKVNSNVVFLVIGKTHPDVVKSEGENYRNFIESKVKELQLENHVLFINEYLPLQTLLEYLQLTDIYLFTSKNPTQAVSGTFAYAMGCGCAIISTPIPHVKEVLNNDTGVIIDFQNSQQLSENVIRLLNDENQRKNIRSNALQKIQPTAWENAAVSHAMLFKKVSGYKVNLKYNLPEVKMDHIRKLTTDFGMIQFSEINQPDINSGYTLDDNARALIATSMHYESTGDIKDIQLLRTYIYFVNYCQQENGNFLNYVDENKKFTAQNKATNLQDSNGRIIWALGYFISMESIMPDGLIAMAKKIIQRAMPTIESLNSPRAIAFTIKGLYYYNKEVKEDAINLLIEKLGDKLVGWYEGVSDEQWQWFEPYLTYANSILPEAMVYVYLQTNNSLHKKIAINAFDFLLQHTFQNNQIKIISNKSWFLKGIPVHDFGEQPIDVSYTIMSLQVFYNTFKKDAYRQKMRTAFEWFSGNNHLGQIVYNPCTGGCYDGLEEHHVNLNQGAESTVCYLMARMTMDKFVNETNS